MNPGRSRTPRGQSDVFWSPRDIIADLELRNGAPYAVDFAADERNRVAPTWASVDGLHTITCGATHFSPVERGALGMDWAAIIAKVRGPGWCNPPFSKPNLPDFTGKAWAAAPRLRHPLDLLVPASSRAGWNAKGEAGWFGKVWEGQIQGYHAINHGPLRGQVIRLQCRGYTKELIFFGYSLAFLENGVATDSGLGSHVLIRLRSNSSGGPSLLRAA